jgi:hypothetical protein
LDGAHGHRFLERFHRIHQRFIRGQFDEPLLSRGAFAVIENPSCVKQN